MKHIDYLYKNNVGSFALPHLKNNRTFEYKSNVKRIDFAEIAKLIRFFSAAEKKFGNSRFLRYKLYFKQVEFADKLSYVLLECLLYHQIIILGKDVEFYVEKYKNTIFTEGCLDSCLQFTHNKESYKKTFLRTITAVHYRKVIEYDAYMADLSSISAVMMDLTIFLKNCGLKQSPANSAAEIVSELIDNALEHSLSDCLVDVDVSRQPYFYTDKSRQTTCFAVNIAVLNFSDFMLGKNIGECLEQREKNNEAYKKLDRIKKKHEEYFDYEYTKSQFYMMSAFQNKISSRKNVDDTGGKGLTKLIDELQSSSVSDVCYVVSDDTCLFFVKDYIKQDENKWVGFNFENNCELPPNRNIIKKSPLNIFGTAYNLTFAFDKEGNDDTSNS